MCRMLAARGYLRDPWMHVSADRECQFSFSSRWIVEITLRIDVGCHITIHLYRSMLTKTFHNRKSERTLYWSKNFLLGLLTKISNLFTSAQETVSGIAPLLFLFTIEPLMRCELRRYLTKIADRKRGEDTKDSNYSTEEGVMAIHLVFSRDSCIVSHCRLVRNHKSARVHSAVLWHLTTQWQPTAT